MDIRTIIAKDGFTFIRDGVDVGSLIYLGKNDSPDNYKEVSIDELSRDGDEE